MKRLQTAETTETLTKAGFLVLASALKLILLLQKSENLPNDITAVMDERFQQTETNKL